LPVLLNLVIILSMTIYYEGLEAGIAAFDALSEREKGRITSRPEAALAAEDSLHLPSKYRYPPEKYDYTHGFVEGFVGQWAIWFYQQVP